MINVKNFHSNLLKIDKKSHKNIDIYYIGYITIKRFSGCKNIHSVNPLYLIIHSATGYFKEENDENDEKNGENDLKKWWKWWKNGENDLKKW